MAKKKVDPVNILREVYWSLRSHQQAEAITLLFEASTAPELPAEWSRGLKSLTRQVRRIASFEQQAVAALVAGKKDVALKRVRLAEEILRKAPAGLTVEYRHPFIGSENLARHVLEGAKKMLTDTRRRIIELKPPPPKKAG